MGYKFNLDWRSGSPYGAVRLPLGMLLVAVLSGCIGPQVHSTAQHRTISLAAGQLQTHGVAFITPSTVTGQEEDKQALAFSFEQVLARERPNIRSVSLAETLSAINRSGLTEEYKRMYEDYRDTGIFKKQILEKVGKLTGSRYLIQLKLAGFSQGSQNRWGFFGIRMLETKYTNIRLFFQVWDSKEGGIAWEGVEELNYAYDTPTEKAVAFKTAVEETAKNLIGRLP